MKWTKEKPTSGSTKILRDNIWDLSYYKVSKVEIVGRYKLVQISEE